MVNELLLNNNQLNTFGCKKKERIKWGQKLMGWNSMSYEEKNGQRGNQLIFQLNLWNPWNDEIYFDWFDVKILTIYSTTKIRLHFDNVWMHLGSKEEFNSHVLRLTWTFKFKKRILKLDLIYKIFVIFKIKILHNGGSIG